MKSGRRSPEGDSRKEKTKTALKKKPESEKDNISKIFIEEERARCL